MATIPVFTSEEAIAGLLQAVHAKANNFYAMYSSVLGGIVTDPALMVLPLDDHMVHRGHAVLNGHADTRNALSTRPALGTLDQIGRWRAHYVVIFA
jgi:hypothetical protein